MTLDELANRLDDGVAALEQIARLLDRALDELVRDPSTLPTDHGPHDVFWRDAD